MVPSADGRSGRGPLAALAFVTTVDDPERIVAAGLGHSAEQAERPENAKVALARKLVTLLRRLWQNGTAFRRPAAATA